MSSITSAASCRACSVLGTQRWHCLVAELVAASCSHMLTPHALGQAIIGHKTIGRQSSADTRVCMLIGPAPRAPRPAPLGLAWAGLGWAWAAAVLLLDLHRADADGVLTAS